MFFTSVYNLDGHSCTGSCWGQKLGHVVNYGSAIFASSQHGPMHKIDNPYRVSVFSLKTIIHFRWYLHDFEAMNSQFHPCLASMFNTRISKNWTFLSQHVEAMSASLFNVFALPQFVRQTNANT